MRISEEDIFIIKSTILKYIQNAKIILFGSRIDDNKKGGDIDILVQTDESISLKQELKILAEIELKGISRKIDLLFQTTYYKKSKHNKYSNKRGNNIMISDVLEKVNLRN